MGSSQSGSQSANTESSTPNSYASEQQSKSAATPAKREKLNTSSSAMNMLLSTFVGVKKKSPTNSILSNLMTIKKKSCRSKNSKNSILSRSETKRSKSHNANRCMANKPRRVVIKKKCHILQSKSLKQSSDKKIDDMQHECLPQSKRKERSSLKSLKGEKLSRPMIPYTVSSRMKKDSNFAELIFDCCIKLKTELPSPACYKIPSEDSLKSLLKKVKQPSVSLSRCIYATTNDKVFYYAGEKMPEAKNSFLAKRWFTTGLHKVDYNMEHKIKMKVNLDDRYRSLITYVCKDDKKCQYEKNVNNGTALVNDEKINADFYVCNHDKEVLVIGPGSVYFFYTACLASFSIEHNTLPMITPFKNDSAEPKNLSTTKVHIPSSGKSATECGLEPLNLTSPTTQMGVKSVWTMKDGNVGIKKIKVETDVESYSKTKNERIAELEQQLSEAKMEIDELKESMKQTAENLKETLNHLRNRIKPSENK